MRSELPAWLGTPILYAGAFGFAGLLILFGWLHRNLVLVLASMGIILSAVLAHAQTNIVVVQPWLQTNVAPRRMYSPVVAATNYVTVWRTNYVTVTKTNYITVLPPHKTLEILQ